MISTKKALRLGASCAALALCIGLAAAPASAKDVRLWQRQIGTANGDQTAGVTVDKDGNAYLAGTTWGSFAAPNQGLGDAWIAKYTSDGRPLWKTQFGTAEGDMVSDVAGDGEGNVYLAGELL